MCANKCILLAFNDDNKKQDEKKKENFMLSFIFSFNQIFVYGEAKFVEACLAAYNCLA